MSSIFDPSAQHDEIQFKIIAGLDRISQALKSIMWEQGKQLGLTPIQMQCLIFVKYHDIERRRAGQLAKEFDVTPATISQAVTILRKKGLLKKQPLEEDARIQILTLTNAGEKICNQIDGWANVLVPYLENVSNEHKQVILTFLMSTIAALQKDGMITVARQCGTCRFFRTNGAKDSKNAFYCKLLEKHMSASELRIDCPEHEQAG